MHQHLHDSIYQALCEGAVVITPNDRLARTLRDDYLARTQQKVIQKPECLSWPQWTQKLLNASLLHSIDVEKSPHPINPPPLLLTRNAISHLWKQILVQQGNTIYQGLISTLEDTARTCQLWDIDLEDPLFEDTEQTLFFKICFQLFQDRLSELHAITPEQIIPYILQNTPPLPSHVIWCCFDEFTPQQRTLQAHLQAQGVQVSFWDFEKNFARTQLYQAIDEHDELMQIILWLQKQLSEDKQRIGVVIPDLEKKKWALTRLLNQHLSPNQYNLSLGQPLSEIPLIAHALTWLNLKQDTISRQNAELLLQSPFIKGAKRDLHAASAFHNTHILLQDTVIDFPVFIQELKKTANTIATALENLTPYPDKADTGDWIHYLLQRLTQIGFPGDYPQDSATYQAYQRFLLIFDEFAQLNTLSSTMTQYEALANFEALAANTVFKPQMPPAPIQISGMLEASGIIFDTLWICGLTDECLPQKTKFSPFIPLPLQKKAGLPYTNPAQELKLARQTLKRFLCTSATLHISYPTYSGDKPNRQSALLVECMPNSTAFTPELNTATWSSLRLGSHDNPSLPLTNPGTFRGTTRLLANQAQCPFRAFAKHRLNAHLHVKPCDGFSKKDRGIIMHRIMELLWIALKNQSNLHAISENDLMNLIENCINTALLPHQMRSYALPPILQTLEKKRLSQLILNMLVWEKKRAPFTVVEVEKQYSITLGELSFQIRIDRKDRIEEKQDWIIDYKSKLPDSTPWFEEKPKEPQILLYALLDEAIQTIVFAEPGTPEPTFKGLSNSETQSSGIKTLDATKQSWDTLKGEWRTRLETLANAFSQGECTPLPTTPAVCTTCEFQNLCRAPLT